MGEERREALANYLRAKLECSGLAGRELARRLNRHHSYVTNLLTSARRQAPPDPDELSELASVLGIPFVELLSVAWGLNLVEMATELDALGFGGLSPRTLDAQAWREIRDFAAFVEERYAVTDGGVSHS